VTVRGNRRGEIFRAERDMDAYLLRLELVTEQVGWTWHAVCLMPNHAHLLLECGTARLSKGMQLVSGGFAQWFNRRYDLSGHHFQGRFHAEPVSRTEHLVELVRYLALNPVRAGLCASPQAWRWSSYGALIGDGRSHKGLQLNATRQLFGTDDVTAIGGIRVFVEAPPLSTRDISRGQTPGRGAHGHGPRHGGTAGD
jgi:REP element-mobilizing transposase RayT